MTPTRFSFFFSFSFFLFGLLITRVSPSSTLVNDPLFLRLRLWYQFAKPLYVCPICFFLRHLFPASCALWEHIPPSRLEVFVLDVWSSERFVIDAYSTRFWAYVLPQTWSARALTWGRTASKTPPYRKSQHYLPVTLNCSLFEFVPNIFVGPFS